LLDWRHDQEVSLCQKAPYLTISPEEVREIEAEAAPAREKVRKMFEAYRPALRANGNDDGERQRTVDVQIEQVKAEPVDTKSAEDAAISERVRRKFAQYRPDTVPDSPTAQPPIVRNEGDENSSAFWLQFVSGNGQRLVEKTTAVFVVKTVVGESIGPRYSNQRIAFGAEPITVADVLVTIERLCGGNPAWCQHLQRKAGF